MAKTKRTVEEVNVAASNDSKLITQSKLSHFATRFWDKIKTRYDGTFKKAILTEDKELIFTKTDDSTQKLDLREYARLKDRNEFKQDVSADNVAILNNRHIGTSFTFTSNNRSLGFRGLTTDSFSDGYVDHIRIYMPNDIVPGTISTWFVWAVKKGEGNRDRVVKVIHRSKELSVDSITENPAENSVVKKFVNIPINDYFENDTYFIVRCTTHSVEVVQNIKNEYTADVINMNNDQPPLTENSIINWESGANVTNSNTVVMQLFGRESIGTLSLKLNKLSPDSGLYVKQEETTKTGGTASANKVVRLDNTGKLNKDMLPSIAINEYFQIEQFTHEKLNLIKDQFENGDVVVVTGNGANHGKRFLCVNKQDITDLRECFIELNSKDGSVVSVNRKTGAVNLTLETADDKLKLKITGGGGDTDVTETTVDIITDGEIDSMIERLQ